MGTEFMKQAQVLGCPLPIHFYGTSNITHFFKTKHLVETDSALVAVAIILLPLGVQLDDRVNAHDGYAGLDGTLQLLDLAHAGLEDTGLQAVVNASLHQVQAVVAVRLLLGNGLFLLVGITFLHALRQGVAHTQLGDELGRVLGGVDGQRLGDDKQRLGELADGKLLTRAL